jgi:adenosylhomocysteinase
MTTVEPLATYADDHLDRQFFERLVPTQPRHNVDLIVLTHLLPDRPPLIEALKRVARIGSIVPVSYSLNAAVYDWATRSGLPVTTWTAQPENAEKFLELMEKAMDTASRGVIIADIGGWFSSAATIAHSRNPGRLLGVVEDTEIGHRRYLEAAPGYPVLSLARSPLKDAEDELVGASVVFSIESAVRGLGRTLAGRNVLVLGFGKIGSSVARAAGSRGASVAVFDTRAHRCAVAIAAGFRCPPRVVALHQADIIIGCTGTESLSVDDLQLLRPGVILASASSKRVEFGFSQVDEPRPTSPATATRPVALPAGGSALLLSGGTPVNFSDDAVVGPSLRLVQGGLVMACVALADGIAENGVTTVDQDIAHTVGNAWMSTYVGRDGLLLPG